jgi:predicted lipid-binding transport protein (Tim44 family)
LFSGGGYQNKNDFQMRKQFDEQAAKNQVRPEKSSEETHNDRQVFIGLLNGVLIGGALTGVGGYLAKWSVITVCFAVFGGVVVGGLIGAMITRLVLWVNGRKEKKASPDKNQITVDAKSPGDSRFDNQANVMSEYRKKK